MTIGIHQHATDLAGSLRTDIVDPQTAITANVQPSATDHRVRKIRIGWLTRQVELTDDVEAPWRDLQQRHRPLISDRIQHALGAGQTDFAQRPVELDGFAGKEVDAVDVLASRPTRCAEQLAVQQDGTGVAVIQILAMPDDRR